MPVTHALTLIWRIATNVEAATTATAIGTVGRPGQIVERTALIPSPATGGKNRLLKTLTPSITKPASGPKVLATATYSPPATGQALDSSA